MNGHNRCGVYLLYIVVFSGIIYMSMYNITFFFFYLFSFSLKLFFILFQFFFFAQQQQRNVQRRSWFGFRIIRYRRGAAGGRAGGDVVAVRRSRGLSPKVAVTGGAFEIARAFGRSNKLQLFFFMGFFFFFKYIYILYYVYLRFLFRFISFYPMVMCDGTVLYGICM